MIHEADDQRKQSDRLNQVLGEYVRRCDAGETVDIESFCLSHPDLAPELRAYANGEGLLAALGEPVDQAKIESDVSRMADTVRPGPAWRVKLSPNAQFGRYRILRLLGEGAMGSISLAEDTHLGRQVAIKIPKQTGLEDDDFRQRFTREARAAAKLDHPNICRVYDAGEINGTPYITMEYLDGPPLSQFLGNAEFQDQRRLAEVVCGIARGLAHAHGQGILHRDLKPGNVLMKGASVPCVTDFGLARVVDGGQESRLTHEGTILGTPAYMSPEQIEGKQDRIGPATDIYALGVLLYELLTGQIPFQGSILSILGQALRDRPAPPSKLRTDVDPQLADLCLQMLEKAPEERPSSMQEVADRLQGWLDAHAPENKAAQAESRQSHERLEGMKARILDLIQRGQFAAAIAGLEKMLDLKAPEAAEYIDWARQKLPEIKQKPRQLKQGVPALLTTAKRCLRERDYAQAAQLLQGIPRDFRSEEVQQLLDKAIDLQEEADLLLADLQECVRQRQYEGIDENLKRFLKLKPGNKFARELFELLNTYSQVPPKQRKLRYDEKGRLLPMQGGSLWDNWLLWGSLCFLLVFGAMTWGITIYLRSDGRTLAVEVDEDWLKEQGGKLTLSVDGKEHTLTGPGLDLKVTLGEHGFSVKNAGAVIHNPQTFTIEKEGRQVLHIDGNGMNLVRGTPAAPQSDPPESESDSRPSVAAAAAAPPPGQPAPAPPLAIVAAPGAGAAISPALPQAPRPATPGTAWQATLEQQTFLDEVAGLPVEQQAAAVARKLQEINPRFDGRFTHRIEGGRVVRFAIPTAAITDIWPVRALRDLRNLDCRGPEGNRARFNDLAPLAGMQLTELACQYTSVADLTPLAGMPLTRLLCSFTEVSDLSPLSNAPLAFLDCAGSRVSDLSPLAGTPLNSLNCSFTRVSDLSPVKQMPLRQRLYCNHTLVSTFQPLAELPAKFLTVSLPLFHAPDEAILRGLAAEKIGSEWNNVHDVDQYWREFTQKRQAAEAFANETVRLPVDEQTQAITLKLCEMNDTANIDFTPVIRDGAIVEATVRLPDAMRLRVEGVAPLRALMHLRKLTITGQLQWLDLSPISNQPLEELNCDQRLALRNATMLTGIETLKTINGQPAKEYLADLRP